MQNCWLNAYICLWNCTQRYDAEHIYLSPNCYGVFQICCVIPVLLSVALYTVSQLKIVASYVSLQLLQCIYFLHACCICVIYEMLLFFLFCCFSCSLVCTVFFLPLPGFCFWSVGGRLSWGLLLRLLCHFLLINNDMHLGACLRENQFVNKCIDASMLFTLQGSLNLTVKHQMLVALMKTPHGFHGIAT